MIQVINRALDIMELVSQDRSRLYTLSEISNKLKLNNGTCANIIKTLVNRGYLEREGRMTGYRLGSMSYLLTGNYSHKRELLKAASGPMDNLLDELNESCILSVLKDNMRLVLHEVKSTNELQVINKKEKEVYRTSTGRMILACLDKKEQKKFIKKYGLPSQEIWPEIEDEEDLMIELVKIRKKQLAMQTSASLIIGMAAPIFKEGNIIASIGIYVPKIRFSDSTQKKVLEELKKTANLINHELNK